VEQVAEKTGHYASLLLDYNAVSNAIRRSVNHLDNQYNCLPVKQKSARLLTPKVIRLLITKDKACTPCSVNFWLHKYNYTINKKHWLLARSVTKEERLRLLQWKILNNIYPTMILLHKMKIYDSNRCRSCGEIDYLEHFFWYCPKLIPFWNNVKESIFRVTGLNIDLSETDVMFGYEIDSQNNRYIKIINHILLIAKMVISKFRYGHIVNIIFAFQYDLQLRHVEDV
jgi:hypothetical protein